MAENLVLYNSFHVADAEGWHYVYTPANHFENWKFDGPTFYAYTSQVSGTVPIYQDYAGNPQRYRFTADAHPGQGWTRNPKPAFFAYPYVQGKAQPSGTIPVYTYYAVGTEGWRYSYTTEGLWGIGWKYAGIDFYAPTPDNHTYPPYNIPPSIEKIPAQDEFQIGWGINVASGQLGDFAVQGLQTTSYNDFREERNINFFSSSSDFADAAEALVHYQACGLGNSLAASAQFLASTNISEMCLSLEVDSTAQTRVELLDLSHTLPQLNAEALNLLKQDPSGFVNRYGTHFIGGFIYGGYFAGTLNLSTQSKSQQVQLAADLKKSVNLWLAHASTSAQFSADLASTHVTYILAAQATISGQPVNTNISDPDAMITEGNQFAQQLSAQPGQGVRTVAICYTWDVLPGVVQVLNEIPPDKRGVFQSAVQPYVALTLTRELAALNYLQNTVTVALNETSTYTADQVAALAQSKIDIGNGILKISDLDAASLSQLTLQTTQQYLVSASIGQKIDAIIK